MRIDDFADAEEALLALLTALQNNDPYKIALLDHNMPGMDGESLGRKIKINKILKSTPLIMLASLGQKGDAERVKRSGFAAYLAHPIKHQNLKGALCAVLGIKTKEVTTGLVTKYTLAESEAAETFAPIKTKDGNQPCVLLAEEPYG